MPKLQLLLSRFSVVAAILLATSTLTPASSFAAGCSAVTNSATATTTQVASGLCMTEITATSTGATFTVPAHVSSLALVMIGGGGGGGSGGGNWWHGGGGGGAGELVVVSSLSVNAGDVISVAIGAGGVGGESANSAAISDATNGGSSIFGSYTAAGGVGGRTHGYSKGGDGGGPSSARIDGATTTYSSGTGRETGVYNGSGGGGGGAGAAGSGSNGGQPSGGNGGAAFVESFSGNSIQLGAGGKGGHGTSGVGSADERTSVPTTPGGGGIGSRGGSNTHAYGGPGAAGGIYVFFNAAPVPTWTNGQVDRANTTTSTLKVATDGESVVTITGTNLSDVFSVTVNGQSASFSAVSATRLIFDAPADSVGTYDLVITNASGSLTKANYIQYLDRPTVTTDAVINGFAVASQSLTISASTWVNWNSKQWGWYRCDVQILAPQDGLPSDCTYITGSANTYELKSADICKFVTLREDVNNAGVYASFRTVASTTRVLASSSPWVLVTDSQNNVAETCSTSSSTVPAATTKSGFDFVEWNTAADGSGSSYQPGAPLSLTGNLQLYAIYATPRSDSGASENPAYTYEGPTLNPLKSLEITPGESVLVEGSKLDHIYKASVDGIELEIRNQSSSTLELWLPNSMSPGSKDVVFLSDYGKLTVLDLLVVDKPKVWASAPSSRQNKVTIGSFNGHVVVYFKGHAGKRVSLRIAGEWLVIDSLRSNFERIVKKRKAGESVDVLVYINRRLTSESKQVVR